MSCPICCDTYTQITRCEITCPRLECSFTCCKNCMKTYFTTSANDPHCMNCKYQFEDTFIIENINRTFFKNDLKKKQTEIWLQIEQSRIPQTQQQAKQVLYLENRKKIYDEVQIKRKKIIQEYDEKTRELKEILGLTLTSLNETIPPIVSVEKPEKSFTIRCQYNDCKGFLSTSYKCGICDKYTCSKCFDGIGIYNKKYFEEHVCDNDKVESVKMIKKETRSCPVCSTRISKIEGCDQMWCTNCNNAFSWKTGLLQTGAIHNPHYFEYLRNQNGVQPRNPLDIPCGGIPQNLHIHTRGLGSKFKNEVNIIHDNIYSIQQFCIHLEQTRALYPLNDKLQELRISYILNRLSMEQWKDKIYAAHCSAKKKKFEFDMSDIIINVGGDLLRNYDKIATENPPHKNNIHSLKDYVLNVIVKEFIQIVTYVNELKMNKAKMYKTKAIVYLMYVGENTYVKNNFTNYEVIHYYHEKTIDPL